MNPEDDVPIDEEELIEVARKIIKVLTENPKFQNLPISISDFQKSLDNFIRIREEEAAVCEAQKQVNEKLQAAWEDVRSAQRKMRAYNRKHGIRDSDIPLVASGRAGLADRVFSQLSDQDQDDTLRIQKKDKD